MAVKKETKLVPTNEQPYEIPENWCWTRLGNITEVIGGGTPSSSVTEYYENGTIPWLSPADLSGYNELYISCGAKNITELGLSKSSARMLPANSVCLSTRAPIGYVVIAQNPLCTNQGFKSFLPSPCYLPQYLYWYLKGNKAMLESYASGTTFLELSGSKAALVEFPLAPLAEQKRIVDRIESLFAKFDEAKVKLEAALGRFEARKVAVLHQAFCGELTKQWRAKNNEDALPWVEASFDSCIEKMQNGLSKRTGIDGTPYTVLRLANLSDNGFITEDLRTIPLTEKEKDSYELIDNDIVMIRVNGSKDNVGKMLLVNKPEQWAFCDHIIRIRCNSCINPSFMVLFSKTKSYRQYVLDNMVSSAGQNTISRKGMSNLTLRLPSLEEQAEIVRILDAFFERENAVRKTIGERLAKIELYKKAILAKAFRGELGTNDPSDQPATELLKEILP